MTSTKFRIEQSNLPAPGGSGNVLGSNGNNWVSGPLTAAQVAVAVPPSSAGKVMTSDGVNWTSAAPGGGSVLEAQIFS